jgi:quercetin dioxygenase-like cupin family protein
MLPPAAQRISPMPFIDTKDLEVLEKRPGWRGRIFSSPQMTFAHWEFEKGSDIHEHGHAQEEVWHIMKGKLEVTIGKETKVAGPGMVAIIPKNERHSVKALTDGMAIVADYPLREM